MDCGASPSVGERSWMIVRGLMVGIVGVVMGDRREDAVNSCATAVIGIGDLWIIVFCVRRGGHGHRGLRWRGIESGSATIWLVMWAVIFVTVSAMTGISVVVRRGVVTMAGRWVVDRMGSRLEGGGIWAVLDLGVGRAGALRLCKEA